MLKMNPVREAMKVIDTARLNACFSNEGRLVNKALWTYLNNAEEYLRKTAEAIEKEEFSFFLSDGLDKEPQEVHNVTA